MIQSLFILSSTGQVLIERHFRGVVTNRSVCEIFWSFAAISLNHHGGLSTNSNNSIMMMMNNQPNNSSSTTTTTQQAVNTATAAASSLLSSTYTGSSSTSDNTMNNNYYYYKPLYDTVPPVIEVPAGECSSTSTTNNNKDQGTLYIISILRDGLSYLSICPAEVSPLVVLEFLHRIADTFQIYFGIPADETSIKDNFSIVYQLLEEMVDYGYPLTTENNALQAMIRPPTVISKLLSLSSYSPTSNILISDELPSGTVSNMPWRTSNVQYTQNEIYMDIIEQVDAIIDEKTNMVIHCDVSGSIQCQSHLSGIPDLLLTFTNPLLMDDVSFHPCVRYGRYEKDHVVSFVPPDGQFELMKYRIIPEQIKNHFISSPISCQTQWTFDHDPNYIISDINTSTTTTSTNNNNNNNKGGIIEQMGRVSVNVGITNLDNSLIYSNTAVSKSIVEDIYIIIPFPQLLTTNTSDFRVNVGTIFYDESAKTVRWNIGKLDTNMNRSASFTCRFTIALNNTSITNDSFGTIQSKTTTTTTNTTTTPFTSSTNRSSSSNIMNNKSNIRSRYGCRISTTKRNNKIINKREQLIQNWSSPILSIGWKIPLASVSGLSVSGLSVTGESYRPYKGVRNITKSGLFQIRSSS